MKTEALEATTAAVASKTTYAGAAVSFYGWLTSNEFAGLVGVLGVVVGIIINWYYKAKRDKREQALVEARIESLRRRGHSDTDLVPLGEDD